MNLDMDLGFRGASQMTGKKLILMFTQFNQLIGGFIWGKAMGNIFNAADMSPVEDSRHQLPSAIGRVKLYISSANQENLDITKMCPAMTAEAPISNTFQPVLLQLFALLYFYFYFSTFTYVIPLISGHESSYL
jgi:hypothetical protein